MGRNQQFEGVYAREASILISFQWQGVRYRERVDLAPTAANLRVAARMRDEVVSAIRIGKFSDSDFARHFPHSKRRRTAGPGETFDDVANIWLQLVEPDVAATTLREYKNALNRYFRPVFGKVPIAAIDLEALALHLASIKLAAKSFNNIMTPARGVFGYAMLTKRVPTDITREIDSRKSQKPGPDPLDVEQIEMVLAHVLKRYGPQYANYFEFAFFSGCRPSEIIALKWASVDLRRQQVRIEAARVRSIDKDTKTHKARDIDLQTRAAAAIQRQKAHSRLASDYVFLNPETMDRFHNTAPPVQNVWRPTLKALGIRDRDARQTRHSFATMCLHAGMNPAYVARQMGHTNARMFFDVYSKWIDGAAGDRERSKLDALFDQGQAKSL